MYQPLTLCPNFDIIIWVRLNAIAMEITRVRLKNIGLFKNLEISLAPIQQNPSNITLLVGNNGAGKTSTMTALATSISWFNAPLSTEKIRGKPIPEDAMLNSANSASIER